MSATNSKRNPIPRGNNYVPVGPLTPAQEKWFRDYGNALAVARLTMDYYQPLNTPSPAWYWNWRFR